VKNVDQTNSLFFVYFKFSLELCLTLASQLPLRAIGEVSIIFYGFIWFILPAEKVVQYTASVALQQSRLHVKWNSKSQTCAFVILFCCLLAATFTFKKRTERVDWRKLGRGDHFILFYYE
jgi:hypothetical protein